MKITFDWNKSKNKIAEDTSGCRDPACILFLANEAARMMDPYVPAKNLALAQNTNVYAESDRGVVEYNSSYAHYQYAGIMYVDPINERGALTNGEGLFWSRPGVAKKPSQRKLEYNTFRHPKATSHWDKAMMAAHGDHLAQAYENHIKSGG